MNDLFININDTAHCILVLAVTIGLGVYLGRIKIKGISVGNAIVLFVGIILSHFGLRISPAFADFFKNFGLVLFVYTLGLSVGPGFFQSFKQGGIKITLLGILSIILSTAVAVLLMFISGEHITTIVGTLSGAITSTPALGAGQQTVTDAANAMGNVPAEQIAEMTSNMANAYAIAYPFGCLGMILVIIILKAMFRINVKKENKEIEESAAKVPSATSYSFRITNPAIFGKNIVDIDSTIVDRAKYVISRIYRNEDFILPDKDSILYEGDKINVVTSEDCRDAITVLFGELLDGQDVFENQVDVHNVSKKIVITKSKITGHKLSDLKIRTNYGVSITRITRNGLELVANPDLVLQVGDVLRVVGPQWSIEKVGKLIGNTSDELNRPNLVPIFLGIALGVVIGCIPIVFPGIPQPVKLGLSGGALIVSILMSSFGQHLHITTYTTSSANRMVGEIGLSIFFACVGLSSGEAFLSSLLDGGYMWFLYGIAITSIAPIITACIARWVFKMDFFSICGMVAGSHSNPSALAFAKNQFGSDQISISYATIYPFTIFLRVVIAQLLILSLI
ncbi:MAG: putative transporter [Bacteroidales bacterium]|nr:putative transporter [Bacteroidales bacterium]